MKVGILSFSETNNYGAVLQAYALKEIVRRLGHHAECIRYPFLSLSRWSSNDKYLRILQSERAKEGFRVDKSFETFRREYLNRSKICRDAKDLRANAGRYDAIIVGSDQVWNTDWCTINKTALPFFLDFTNGLAIRRISYSACCGHPNVEAASFIYAPEWLREFDYVSVRNEYTKTIVQKWGYSGNISITADPTLLLDFSPIISNTPIKLPSEYILLYIFKSSVNTRAEVVLREIRSKMNLPVVALVATTFSDYETPGADIYLRSLTPIEWLYAFSGASFVLTNSFHGTLFSLKNKKPFFSFVDKNSVSRHRIYDLAKRYGVQKAIIDDDDWDSEFDISCACSMAAQPKIIQHVDASMSFLSDALM